MQLISCHEGQLQQLPARALASAKGRTFRTGLRSIDDLLPGGAFSCGSVHEVLAEPGQRLPLFFAAVLAQSAGSRGAVLWCDPQGRIYPPALSSMGIPLDRTFLVKPRNDADAVWTLTECLRNRGVGAVLGSPARLSRTEARRLQLAAEAGGGVGILLRTEGRGSAEYAAATRWRVRPVPGKRTLQRWTLQLIHCHGGQVGRIVVLEACRETNALHAIPAVADRPIPQKPALLRA